MGEGLMPAKSTVKNEVLMFFLQDQILMGKQNTGQFKLIPAKYNSIARVKEYKC